MLVHLTNIYKRYVGKSIFSKSMLIYSVISVIPILLLTIIITNNIGNMLLKKEISKNNIVMYNIGSYFDQKYQSVYSIIEQTYWDSKALPYISDFLESEMDTSDSKYLQYYKSFTNYFYSFFSRDNDLYNVVIYKGLNKKLYIFSKDFERVLDVNSINSLGIHKSSEEKAPKINIYAAHVPDYNKNKMVYSLSINIKVLGTNANSGTLLLDFNPAGIDATLSKLDYSGQEDLYILTSKGDVIYDSTKKYYGKKYPYFDLLGKKVHSATIDGEKCIVDMRTQDSSGVIVASIIHEKKIFKDINSLNSTIYIVTLICIAVALLFTHISTLHFSKRIISITRVMKNVWNGDLSTRIGDNGSKDELGDISCNFDKMCDNLQEYINKVYVLEIKQKNIELAALQAQINPHFLYNTLEAIRMKAETANEKDISNMIYILANIFRNMVKEGTIVSIKDEIELSKSYLQLFKIRHGDKMSYEFNIAEKILEYGIIKHLLQPVIENYIVHGFDLRKEDNKIIISAHEEDNDIYFRIIDNGLGINKQRLDILNQDLSMQVITEKSSIGLRNVNERIKLIYGMDYGVFIDSDEDAGTTVIIKISVKTKGELTACVQCSDS